MSRDGRAVQEHGQDVAIAERPAAERPAVEQGEGVSRGRPGRRTTAERVDAVLLLLAGKASVDQLARKYGVLPATVNGWKDEALKGLEESLRRGDGPSQRERELERELEQLKSVVGQLSIERALAMKAIDEWKRSSRPSRPGRSQR
jgi:transposase-like protein